MKAAVIYGQGEPNVLQIASIPAPGLEPNQVRVKVEAAAVNPVDLKTRSGFLADIKLNFPAVLGWDVAGIVEEIGNNAAPWQRGDRVIAMVAQPVRGLGTYAEYVNISADLLAPAPTSLPLAHAAAIPLGGATAWQALDAVGLTDGTILITGGVGAVGGLAIQLAKLRGLDVIALVSDRDEAAARALGADHVVHRGQPMPASITDGVLDTAGATEAITSVHDNGSFVSIEDVPLPSPERGITPRKSYVNENGGQLRELSELVDHGELQIRIADTYPLADAATAHKRLEAGGVRGKLLLMP